MLTLADLQQTGHCYLYALEERKLKLIDVRTKFHVSVKDLADFTPKKPPRYNFF